MSNLTDIIEKLNKTWEFIKDNCNAQGTPKAMAMSSIKKAIVFLEQYKPKKPYAHKDKYIGTRCTCGKCNEDILFDDFKYCPYCGTKIDWDNK